MNSINEYLETELIRNKVYLTKKHSFFAKHVVPIILARNGSVSVVDLNKVWFEFRKELSREIVAHPSSFVKNIEFPFLNALISFEYLRGHPKAGNDLQWIGEDKMMFIDLSCAADVLMGHGVPVSVLSNIGELRAEAHKREQVRVEDAFLAMANVFDSESYSFTGCWKEELERRKNKKKRAEEKFLQCLKDVWKKRIIIKALNTPEVDAGVELETRLTFPVWRRLVAMEVARALRNNGIKTGKNLDDSLIRELILKNRYQIIVEVIGSDIHNAISKMIRPVNLGVHQIIEYLGYGLFEAIGKPSLTNPRWKDVLPKNKIIASRFRRMTISTKTRLTYESLMDTEAVCGLIGDESFPLYGIHADMSLGGLNSSTIRNFIKTVFSGDVWDNKRGMTKVAHDIATWRVPSAVRFAKKIARNDSVEGRKTLEKVVKLITSEAAGGDFDYMRLNNFSLFSCEKELIRHDQFNSFTQYVAILKNDKRRVERVLSASEAKGLIVSRERDRGIITGMDLGKELTKYLKGMTICCAQIGKKVISKKVGALTVSVVPHDHLLGVMGAAARGVCISFDSRYHKEHFTAHCRNMVIYDEDAIYLWGLLVECQDGSFFMNNFQGALPSRYQKHKQQILHSSRECLSELGDVYLLSLSFNAMNLSENLDYVEKDLNAPKMRLDIEQDKNGDLISDGFFKVGKK